MRVCCKCKTWCTTVVGKYILKIDMKTADKERKQKQLKEKKRRQIAYMCLCGGVGRNVCTVCITLKEVTFLKELNHRLKCCFKGETPRPCNSHPGLNYVYRNRHSHAEQRNIDMLLLKLVILDIVVKDVNTSYFP